MNDCILDRVVCVRCDAALDSRPDAIVCSRCGQSYPRVGNIPVLLPEPHAHVELWRRQLALLLASAASTHAGLEDAARGEGLLPDGVTRLRAMARAVREQADDFGVLLSPALGGPLEGAVSGLPRGVVEYSYYLFRDWGWPEPENRENQQALEALREVGGCELGRVLVVGAGGARLAYDLHRQCGATETTVVDIDPYLFVVAEAVTRGGSVRLTEASLNVLEATHASMGWTLSAPDGRLDAERFHFLLADGLQPPFTDASFDSVVTPLVHRSCPAGPRRFSPDATPPATTGRALAQPRPPFVPTGNATKPAAFARRDLRSGRARGLPHRSLAERVTSISHIPSHRSRKNRAGPQLRSRLQPDMMAGVRIAHPDGNSELISFDDVARSAPRERKRAGRADALARRPLSTILARNRD